MVPAILKPMQAASAASENRSMPEISASRVHLIVALHCEARPLIARYRLKRRMDQYAFGVYENRELCLTVGGIGKTAAAAAVAYTGALFGVRDHPWLNVGVAGHRSHPPGRAFLCRKITDADSGRRFYPPLVFRPPFPGEELCTVSRPETEYGGRSLYDMEASGFFESAARFSSSELVQSLKIVSDNAACPPQQLDKTRIGLWVEQNLRCIDVLIEELRRLAAIIRPASPDHLDDFLARWHFTARENAQLRELLHRCRILCPEDPPTPHTWTGANSAGEVLRRLRERVECLAPAAP